MPTWLPRLALASLVLLPALPVPGAKAQWVLLARRALGRVEQMAQQNQEGRPGVDIATVLLEAPAAKVYATALGMIRRNKQVRITYEDPATHRIEATEGDRTASLRVTALSDKLSQLLIAGTAGPGEDSTTSRVAEAVLRVCREMHKECSLAG